MMDIKISLAEEQEIKRSLEKRGDPEAKRMLRFLNMPDLSRTPSSPLYELVQRTLQTKSLADFDVITIPEIVPTHVTFDLFNMPPGHPARSTSDTYYANDEYILRTHDTVMWHYYLNNPAIKERIKKQEPLGVICYGKVYRKDEIDRRHMNVFHQLGGLYLVPDSQRTINLDDLKNVLTEIAQNIFGANVKNRFNEDNFPYTDPSLEMEIEIQGQWIEMLGCGLPRKSVLANFGLTGYNGWAFGFGLERLAIVSMQLPDIRLLWSKDERVVQQLKLGNPYKEVSKYPPITRDISFVVVQGFVPNNYFDLIREIGGDLVEEVQLIDTYGDAAKFGPDKVSYTYRIVYRSNERTLESQEIDALQEEIYKQTAKQFGAQLR
jgi:phenylalanyl-tRNA synthetase alpha chain